jgi:uncharacterized membrane protein
LINAPKLIVHDTFTQGVIRRRLEVVDVARGVAIVLMFAYHLCFDLNYFGYIKVDFHASPFWLNARSFIVMLFLLVMGMSLFLAHAEGIRWSAVRRRTMQLVLAAAVVTAGSYLLFPHSYIFFGVLHFIALASLLALPFVRFRRLALFTGLWFLWLGINVSHSLFDQPLLNWVGLMTHKPITEDYVPLLPWMGVVLLGIYLGSLLPRFNGPLVLWRSDHKIPVVLSWAGRHSLLLYLLHQPVLLTLIYLLIQLR